MERGLLTRQHLYLMLKRNKWKRFKTCLKSFDYAEILAQSSHGAQWKNATTAAEAFFSVRSTSK